MEFLRKEKGPVLGALFARPRLRAFSRSESSSEQRGGEPPGVSKMPKMKTKSAAKKRFKITGTGKVLSQPPASATA